MAIYSDDADHYPYPDEIDFSRIWNLLRELALFDDSFLGLQALNIGMVDKFITDCEYSLLREYIELERTPTESALFVSAQSQMWMFALYELLRTWRQRVRRMESLVSEMSFVEALKDLDGNESNVGAMLRRRQIEKLRDDEKFRPKLSADFQLMEPVFRLVESIRMNLAKHEVKGDSDIIVSAPGYGRINGECGAMDFEVDTGEKSYQLLNRRDIAEALRNIKVSGI